MASLIMYHQVNQVSTHDKQLGEPALIFIVVISTNIIISAIFKMSLQT